MKRLALVAVAALLLWSQTVNGQRVGGSAAQVDAPPLSFTRITVGRSGEPSNGDSGKPAISANGRFIAYISDATNLVIGDTNGQRDVFVYDRGTGRTTLESVNSSGAEANGYSDEPSISDDGRYVLFHSAATNLVAGSGGFHVYLRDRVLGTTTLIDRPVTGPIDDASYPFHSVMNDDGRYVAFSSSSPRMVAGDTDGCENVFVRDVSAGVTERVSVGQCGQRPSISGDGRYVAFESEVGGNHAIFIRDRVAGITSLESNGSDAFLDWSIWPSLSGDGRFLSWYRTTDTGAPGMYIRDRTDGRLGGPFVSRPSEDWVFTHMGRTQPYVSYISSLGFFATIPPEAYLLDLTTQSFVRLSPGSNATEITPVAGNAVAVSSAVALVPTPTNYKNDIYVITPASGGPGVPRTVVSTVSGTTVTLTWEAPAAGDPPSEYVIAAGSEPGRTDAAIIATGSRSTTFSAAVPSGGTFYVRIHARNPAGTSGPSNEVRVVVDPR
jgi:hypothetical protein